MNILTLFLTFKQIDSYYNYLILNIIYKMCLCDLAQTALGAETVALPFWNGSVHFSRSVVSDSLRPHESQHARPPYPSPTPGVYSNPCPSSP